MDNQRDNRMMVGAILIVAGIGFLALQFLGDIGDSATTFFIGVLFLAGYLYRRNHGLLVPAGILMGLGLGSVAESSILSFNGLSNIGLGVGFLSIFLIGYAYEGRTHWWPLVPGTALVLVGLAQGSQVMRDLLEFGWPLILVLVGLALLSGATFIRRR